MSMSLQYAAQCAECLRPMRPGTEAEYYKASSGDYRYIHADGCPEESATAPPPARRTFTFSDHFDIRQCSAHCGEWAFNKGWSPLRCHKCGAAWLEREAADDVRLAA